jgi:hypothetical protein
LVWFQRAALQEAVGGRNDEAQDVSAMDTSAAGANILNPMVRQQYSTKLAQWHCLLLELAFFVAKLHLPQASYAHRL